MVRTRIYESKTIPRTQVTSKTGIQLFFTPDAMLWFGEFVNLLAEKFRTEGEEFV